RCDECANGSATRASQPGCMRSPTPTPEPGPSWRRHQQRQARRQAGRGSAPGGPRLRSGHHPARGGAVPRRQLVMIAVVLAAVLGAALLIWRGEGLAGGFALIALAAIILLQMDARRRLSDLAADVRRNRAELRTAVRRTHTQESELKELGRQRKVSARAAGQARDHTEAVLDRLDQVEGLLAQQTEDAVKHRRALHRDRRMRSRDNL